MIKIRNKLFARKKRQPNNTIYLGTKYHVILRKVKKIYYSEVLEVNKMNTENMD